MQFTGVSQATFNALRTKLATTQGTEITGTTEGTIKGKGVTANYRYDSVQQTLSVDVVRRPFFIPASTIESQIRDAIAESQKA